MHIVPIMDEYEAPLLRYVSQLVWPDVESSQDIVQETFLRLHRLIEQGKGSTVKKVNQWLFRVAHNMAMDVQRRRGRTHKVAGRLHEDPVLNPETNQSQHDARTALEHHEACEAAMRALHQLPEDEKQIISLKIIEELTLREISEITGLKIGTVHYRLTAGLQRLSSLLQPDHG